MTDKPIIYGRINSQNYGEIHSRNQAINSNDERRHQNQKIPLAPTLQARYASPQIHGNVLTQKQQLFDFTEKKSDTITNNTSYGKIVGNNSAGKIINDNKYQSYQLQQSKKNIQTGPNLSPSNKYSSPIIKHTPSSYINKNMTQIGKNEARIINKGSFEKPSIITGYNSYTEKFSNDVNSENNQRSPTNINSATNKNKNSHDNKQRSPTNLNSPKSKNKNSSDNYAHTPKSQTPLLAHKNTSENITKLPVETKYSIRTCPPGKAQTNHSPNKTMANNSITTTTVYKEGKCFVMIEKNELEDLKEKSKKKDDKIEELELKIKQCDR